MAFKLSDWIMSEPEMLSAGLSGTQGNPLVGTVEENKRRFDQLSIAIMNRIRQGLREFELNDGIKVIVMGTDGLEKITPDDILVGVNPPASGVCKVFIRLTDEVAARVGKIDGMELLYNDIYPRVVAIEQAHADTLTARTQAQNAKTAAETALGQAQTAKTEAETARTQAQSAKTAAETALSQAQTANSSAQTAKTAAETARTQAQTAKTAAEKAKSDTQVILNSAKTEINSAKTAALSEVETAKSTIPADYMTTLKDISEVSLNTGVQCVAKTTSENGIVTVSDTADNKVVALRIFGKSVQAGVPSPDSPVPIESLENPVIFCCGKNLANFTQKGGTGTISGVVIEKPGDGTYILSGAYTGDSENIDTFFSPDILLGLFVEGHRYIANDCKIVITQNGTDIYRNEFIFDGTMTRIRAYVQPKKSEYNNVRLTLYPMLYDATACGSAEVGFEPYKGNDVANVPYTLRGIDDVRDELIVYQDGTGKMIKRVDEYNSDTAANKPFMNTGDSKIYADCKTCIANVNSLCNLALHYDWAAQNPSFYVNSGRLFIFNMPSVAANHEALRAWLTTHQIIVVYQLAKPVVTELTAEQVKVIIGNLRSYKPNTTITISPAADMELTYIADAKTYIDNKFDQLATALVAIGGTV